MATATDRQKTAKENFSVPDSGERKVSLLVVEDDENISTAISEYFSRAGYNVKTVEDGLNGVKAALDDPPDAVVLDLMLPKMDGLAVCKELREKVGYLPILMLTAKDDVVDKVLGLEMGADDYITKPFSLRELEARIKSVLRRTRNGPTTDGMRDEAPIVRGRLRIDSAKREVTIGDRQVELTPKEFDLLRLFASNPGRVFPRKYLLEKIWDYSYEGYDRTIWIDADILVFDEPAFRIEVASDFAFCYEVWLWKEQGATARQAGVNNSVSVFVRGNAFLDFCIWAHEDLVRRGKQVLTHGTSTRLLSALYRAVPFTLLTNVGMLSPVVAQDIRDGTNRIAREYAGLHGRPLRAINLCGSMCGKMAEGRVLDDGDYGAIVDTMLRTRGAMLDRDLLA